MGPVVKILKNVHNISVTGHRYQIMTVGKLEAVELVR